MELVRTFPAAAALPAVFRGGCSPLATARGKGLLLAIASAVAALLAGSSLAAADLLPPERSIPEAVDHYLAAELARAGVEPAPPADDATVIRRTTLDLVGRIPTVAETKAYCESTAPDKRAALVARLIASRGFIRYQAYELDLMLMPGSKDSSLRKYLAAAVEENRSWDRIFRDLMLVGDESQRPPDADAFLKARISDIDRMTTEVSVLFFGVNVSCAQCHDHPLVSDWEQGHYYGMKSFFNRTFDAGGFIAEKGYGGVNYKRTDGEQRDARLMFLTGTVVDEPQVAEPSEEEKKKEKEAIERAKKDKKPLPPPAFSRRAQLVEVALRPAEREMFAKAIVNRVWARLFGRGLVSPLDQMHSANGPSHPQLLDWLARDFAEQGYDLRRLIAGLVQSAGYARSSRWDGEKPPADLLFARALVRPLTPQQYAASLKLAVEGVYTPGDLPTDEFEKRMQAIDDGARGLASKFEVPRDDFQVSADEALAMSNAKDFNGSLLPPGEDKDPNRLLGRLRGLEDDRALAAAAVEAVLSRPADDEEIAALADYLGRRRDRRSEAIRQIVWAMLASSEFRFNH